MRGRSYSPSPPRGGYGRRGRSPSPRGRGGYVRGGRGGASDLPTSLLVRNLRHDCRPEDLRRPFEQFGALKDIYLPRDYYTGEPRGFGFVQYSDPHDAAEAKHHMDGRVLLGRELTVVFAEENRKKPSDMRSREKPSRSRFRDRRRSPPRYSRSPPPRYGRSRSRSREYFSPPKRQNYSRSVSPQEKRYSRERSYSRSRSRSRSPIREPSRSPRRSRSLTPIRSRSRTPIRSRSQSPRRSRSQSPTHDEFPRETNGDRSPSR
ncbi:Serine/arginine-rich SC35-like splicing factor SCL30A [Euphorbia peplus]|nr:Serine/arginine-rich SC35-like splicing factor SCL30A [Euphorbia peplus]